MSQEMDQADNRLLLLKAYMQDIKILDVIPCDYDYFFLFCKELNSSSVYSLVAHG